LSQSLCYWLVSLTFKGKEFWILGELLAFTLRSVHYKEL
jgi:hypothetical protein